MIKNRENRGVAKGDGKNENGNRNTGENHHKMNPSKTNEQEKE